MDSFPADTPEQAATQAIRDYCGWHVAPVIETTLTLDGTGTDTVLLPSRRVIDVLSVKALGVELEAAAYEWSSDGLLRRRRGCWPDRYRALTVELEHGFEDASILATVVDSIVARIRMDPSGMLASQSAGTQRVSFGGRLASGGGGVGLLGTEKELLAPYKLNWGP